MIFARIPYDLHVPSGLRWPDAGDVLVHCRDLIVFTMGRFGTPTELLAQTSVQQSRKFDLLDWLRPSNSCSAVS